MNYTIIFSTYVNATGKNTPRLQVEHNLVATAKVLNIAGFSLREMRGYYAGELEASYGVDLYDITKAQAVKFAELLKDEYSQDSIIVKELTEKVWFI